MWGTVATSKLVKLSTEIRNPQLKYFWSINLQLKFICTSIKRDKRFKLNFEILDSKKVCLNCHCQWWFPEVQIDWELLWRPYVGQNPGAGTHPRPFWVHTSERRRPGGSFPGSRDSWCTSPWPNYCSISLIFVGVHFFWIGIFFLNQLTWLFCYWLNTNLILPVCTICSG